MVAHTRSITRTINITFQPPKNYDSLLP